MGASSLTGSITMSYPRHLVVATGNAKKGIEMAQILGEAGLDIQILTLADFPGVDSDIEETGATYRENAELKARAAAQATGSVCIADDAGLEINALAGQPGLHSKRFLGEDTPFPEKMAHILKTMKDVPDEQRGCRFNCAVAICTPDGQVFHCAGICEGRIAREMRGSHGFGYDPIFYLPQLGKHMAELTPEEKHRISHRGIALACARDVLRGIFGGHR
jgi:XTP/dITP diphosphohydrolase